MKDPYVQCYASGRYDTFDGDVDMVKLAEQVRAGREVRPLTLAAAQAAINGEMDAAVKVQWLKDNLEPIKTMGGDTEKAYRLYVLGRVDNLAHQLEADIMSIVEDQIEEEDAEAEGTETNPSDDDDDDGADEEGDDDEEEEGEDEEDEEDDDDDEDEES